MKRALAIGFPVLALWVVSGFAAVKTDYDRSTVFERYQTYSWKVNRPAGEGLVNNSLVASRIQSAVDRELARKGMHSDDRSPDVYLTYRVNARERHQVESYPYVGWGWGWRRWGWGDRDVYVTRYTEGDLVLDMVDAHTNHLIWRAYCTEMGSNVVDVTSQKKIDKLVGSALKHFPPKRGLKSAAG